MIRAFILLLISLICFSFSFSRKKKLVPPGTVQITETFFADQTEISNFSWREYEWSIAQKYGKNSPEHIAVLPDTLVWRDPSAYNEPYVQYYYRHPAYKDYPVVGVSYEQALAYCKWRTERVKEFYAIRYKKDWNIEYRLPTKEEWEKFALTIGNVTFKNEGRDDKGRATFNCLALGDTLSVAGTRSDNADVTAPVFSYKPNVFKIYNCIGNVAEMISEKGLCKGGSWRNRPEDCRPGKDVPYVKPSSWLGFRCVCVMKSNP